MSLFDESGPAAFLDMNFFSDASLSDLVPSSSSRENSVAASFSPGGVGGLSINTGQSPQLSPTRSEPVTPTSGADFLALTAQMTGTSVPMALCSPANRHKTSKNAPSSTTAKSSNNTPTASPQVSASNDKSGSLPSISALKISSPSPANIKPPPAAAAKATSNVVAAATGGRASAPPGGAVSSPSGDAAEEDDDASDNEGDDQEASYPEGSPEALAAAARKVRNKRACMSCYKAKTKCSPTLPCQRCKRLMIKCEPREHRRRKRRSQTNKQKGHIPGHTHVGQNGFVHGDHCVQASRYISELKAAVASLQHELRTYKLALASSLPTSLPPLGAEELGKAPGQLADPSAPGGADPLMFISRKRQRAAPASAPGPVARSPTAHDAGAPSSANTSPFVSGQPGAAAAAAAGYYSQHSSPAGQGGARPPRVVSPPLQQLQRQQQAIANQQQQLLSMSGGAPTGLHIPSQHHQFLPPYFSGLTALNPGRPHSQSFAGFHGVATATSSSAGAGGSATPTVGGGVVIGNPKAPRAHSTPPSMLGSQTTAQALQLAADPKAFAASLNLPPSLHLDNFNGGNKNPFPAAFKGEARMRD